MILTTTPIIEGHVVKRYCGIVSAETILGANMLRDISASICDFLGGRARSYEEILKRAKDAALGELQQRAQALGANAVVGVSLDYETVGASSSMLMVVATGTAVQI